MILSRFILSIIGALFCITLFGQTIKGRVVSENTGIGGVQLLNKLTNQVLTTTEENGAFELKGLTHEKYILVFTRVGFVEKEETVDLRKNTDVTLLVQLETDPMLFEEIAVIGKKMGLTEKTPYNIARLDAKNVALKGQASGMMGLIQQEPGVRGAEMGHGIVKPFIRGLGFSRVVTIYQGGKLENHQWGADHGLGLNDLGVASVDIIKGPASILYGSGALGGVLVINDDEIHSSDQQLRGTFGTSLNTISGGIRGYGSIGTKFNNGWFISADGAYENHADYFDGDNRLIGNSRFNTKTARIHTGYKGNKFSNKLSYSFNEQYLGIIEDNEMEEGESLATYRSDREMQLPFQRVEDHLISYRQHYQFNPSWKKEMDVTYHYNHREEIEDDFDDIDLGLQQHHVFYNIRFHHKTSESYTQTFGVQGSYIDMRNMLEAEEILFPNAQYFENGLYYLGTYSTGRHTIQGGARADHRPLFADANQENIVEQGYTLPGNPADRTMSFNFFGVTGSLGYTLDINEKNLLKFNVSSGFRSPDLAELLSNGPHPGTNRFEIGNVNSNNEQSFQSDLSWLYRSNHFSFQASVFSNYVNNYIFFTDSKDTTDTGLNIWVFEQTNAFLYGGEMTLSYKPLGTNKLKIDLFGNIIRGTDLLNKQPLTFIPADRVGTQINYVPLKSMALDVFLRNEYTFTQNRPGMGESTTQGYNLLSAGINYKAQLGRQRVNFGVTVFNLFNQTYFDHISILRAFEVTAPGRNLMLNIQWRF